jgi:putative addiction module antidote
MRLKITSVDSALGLVLPKEVLQKLELKEGDSVYLTETADGVRITPCDPEFDRQMELAQDVMKRRAAVLRELAK